MTKPASTFARVYYLLALFNIAVAGASLFMSQRLVELHEQTASINDLWAAKRQRYVEISRQASAADAPGNDVFASRDVAGERARMRTARRQFDDMIERELKMPQGESRNAAAVRSGLLRAGDEVTALAAEAESLFDDLSAGREDGAARHMAAMDQHHDRAQRALEDLRARVAEEQQIAVERQTADAARLRRSETFIAAFVILMVGTAIAYGRRLDAKLRKEAGERQGAIDQLATSEAEYRHLIANSLDAVVGMDLRGRIQVWSPQAEVLFGWTSAEILERGLGDTLVPERMRELFHEDHERYLATGKAALVDRRVEVEALRRDGAEVWVEMTVSAMGVPSGLTFLAFLRDLTDRKQAEAALSGSEARARGILDATVDGIITIDERGRIESANHAVESLFGWTAAEMKGRSVSMIMPEPFASNHDGYLEHYRNTGEKRIIGTEREVLGLRRDESTFPMDLSVSEVRIPGVRLFTGIVRDITERKRVERELISARDAAQSAALAKAEFLANMSHEIRTPLNGVVGMTAILSDTTLVDEQREYVRTIQQCSDTLLATVNDILDFSKLDAGSVEMEQVPFSPRTALEEVAEMLAARAQEKGLEIAVDVSESVPDEVRGDPLRLRQVLMNLAGNAIKFTETGEVVLSISTLTRDDTSVGLAFAVRDTGIGIPADRRDRLFKPFSQVDASTTRRYGGTGLGLAISGRIVELLGGAIAVESHPGQGSLFAFRLTFADPVDLPARGPEVALTGRRVLVVDDNATNRRIVAEFLQAWGCRHSEAESAVAAVQAARDAAARGDPFELAVLDFHMPDTDGLALAKQLRSDPVTAPMKLVLLGSVGSPGGAAALKEAGFEAWLMKPIRRTMLFDTLIRCVRGRTEALPRPAAVAKAAPKARGRVLVVDDSRVNREVLTLALRRAGCRCDTATNGEEAIAAIERESYDLVFMDCQMPVMDGYQAASRIRALPGAKGLVPIVAVTAGVLQGDRQKCLDAGMSDFVGKPFRSAEILTVLNRFVAGGEE